MLKEISVKTNEKVPRVNHSQGSPRARLPDENTHGLGLIVSFVIKLWSKSHDDVILDSSVC